MANKQKHNYSLGYNTGDQIKTLAGSAKGRNTKKTPTGIKCGINELFKEHNLKLLMKIASEKRITYHA